MKNNIDSKITALLFLILIFGFTFLSFFKPVKIFSENENRYLQDRPEFSWNTLVNGEYTSDYETFITDQFILRDQWISLKTMVERMTLKQDVNGVFFGKDGYLIEKHLDSDIDWKQYERNKDRLIEFVQKYGKQLGNDRVKVMMVPTKSAILTNKLPAFAPGFDQDKMIEGLKEQLPDHTLVDVSNILRNHQNEYIYYRTDHHWTNLGAFYAYEQWAKAIGIKPYSLEEFNKEVVSDDFYGTVYSKVNVKVSPDEIESYVLKDSTNYQVDINNGEKTMEGLYDYEKLKGKDKYSFFLGGNNAIVRVKSQVKNNRRLLVIKDSFAHVFLPFAVNHFEETYVIDFRYYHEGMEKFIADNNITDILVLYNTVKFADDKNTSYFMK